MTDAALTGTTRPIPWHRAVWAVLLAFTLALGIWHDLLPWAADYPKAAVIPLAKLITTFSHYPCKPFVCIIILDHGTVSGIFSDRNASITNNLTHHYAIFR